MVRPTLLTDFRSLSAAHTVAQLDSLAWIASAHARSEATVAHAEGRPFDEAAFRNRIVHRLERFGCGADKIAMRGHELGDCAHERWSEMEVYRLEDNPEGEGTLARTRVFHDHACGVLSRLYAEQDSAPDHLVHVTCTGYASPSAAQRVVAEKGWGNRTRVTHAYHMGCYAAFPALRVAQGLALAGDGPVADCHGGADVVHTEMCSLHMNPRLHDPEQLVIQSLFADGFIRYSVCDPSRYDGRAPALALLAQAEAIVPETSDAMSWVCSNWGMQMTLARDVPDKLANVVREFVRRLSAEAGLDESERAGAIYAVHPGGPKILDRMRDVLGLDEAQIAVSRSVLRARGNMSSATVPHLWMQIAGAPDVKDGHPIISLAFGPGLTLCGTVMRKGAA
jgi:predicted naringenin-chalcone synthase